MKRFLHWLRCLPHAAVLHDTNEELQSDLEGLRHRYDLLVMEKQNLGNQLDSANRELNSLQTPLSGKKMASELVSVRAEINALRQTPFARATQIVAWADDPDGPNMIKVRREELIAACVELSRYASELHFQPKPKSSKRKKKSSK